VFLVGVVMVKHNRETKLGGLLGQVRLFWLIWSWGKSCVKFYESEEEKALEWEMLRWRIELVDLRLRLQIVAADWRDCEVNNLNGGFSGIFFCLNAFWVVVWWVLFENQH
jgi:hypothetical protein